MTCLSYDQYNEHFRFSENVDGLPGIRPCSAQIVTLQERLTRQEGWI
jgi:hypothetical protein